MRRSFITCCLGFLTLNALQTGCTGRDQSAVEQKIGAVKTNNEIVSPTVDAEGFIALHLKDFQSFPEGSTGWSEADGVITTTGKPKGYIHSTKSFENFTCRGEFRFIPTDGTDATANDQSNTGFMLCIQEPHRVWPRSFEVQGKHVEMGQIRPNGGVPPLTLTDDAAAREASRRPVGEWNAIEIQCRDGAVTATLNSTVVCRSEPTELKSGMIGLQSENFPVEFRALRLRED